MSATLTKKQQKALAFRSKQKAKKLGKNESIPDDIPEQDPIDDVEAEDTAVVSESSKKRKRTDKPVEEDKSPETGDVAEVEVDEQKTEKASTKAKGKGKAKNAWDDEEEDQGEKGGKKSKKEIKQRFILFVGNLGYKTTREEVQHHFTEAAGLRPSVRLLTTKADPSRGVTAKSRGIAFLELPNSTAMQGCLKLHHSSLQNRTINVELTAGGGGKGEGRKEKIKERNDRVGGQRERRAEREKEAGVGEGDDNAEAGAQGGKRPNAGGSGERGAERPARKDKVEVEQDGEVVGPDGEVVKIRGGRRVKAKTGQSHVDRPNKRPRPDGNDRWQGRGDAGRGGRGGRGGGQGGFRSKFALTGANAVSVG